MHTHGWSRGAIQTAPICSAPTCLEQGKAVPLAAPRCNSSARPTHRALARLPPHRPRTKPFPVGRCCWGRQGRRLCRAVPSQSRGALPRSAPAAAGPARSSEGPGRAAGRAGPAVIALPAPWGHRGAPSRDRASLRAVRRAPSALLHNRRQRRGYTTNGGAAPARPRYRRREGTGPRLSPSAGLTPPPWRPLPRGHLRYLRRVRHPGAAGEQLPFLPFPPCLPPSLTPCPPPPHHRGAGCRRRAPSQPVPSLGSFSFRFFPFPSLPSPVFTPTPPTWK